MQTAKWRSRGGQVMMALVGAPMVSSVAFAAGNKHQAETVEHAKETGRAREARACGRTGEACGSGVEACRRRDG